MATSTIQKEIGELTISSGDLNNYTYPIMVRLDNNNNGISNMPSGITWGTLVSVIVPEGVANPYGFHVVFSTSGNRIATRSYTKSSGFTSWKYITPANS